MFDLGITFILALTNICSLGKIDKFVKGMDRMLTHTEGKEVAYHL